jgi:hypothetical protein
LKNEIDRENTIFKNDDKVEAKKCAVPTCSSPENVIFHKFPEDAKMQSAWIAACDVNNINVKTSFICEKHFVEKSYKHDLVNELLGRPLRRLLRWDAVPTINVPFVVTGKSLSEALVFASTKPQYDDRLFIELQVQYMKIPSSNLGRTCCVQRLFLTFRTIFVHNMYSPCSAKRRASDKDLPVQR